MLYPVFSVLISLVEGCVVFSLVFMHVKLIVVLCPVWFCTNQMWKCENFCFLCDLCKVVIWLIIVLCPARFSRIHLHGWMFSVVKYGFVRFIFLTESSLLPNLVFVWFISMVECFVSLGGKIWASAFMRRCPTFYLLFMHWYPC